MRKTPHPPSLMPAVRADMPIRRVLLMIGMDHAHGRAILEGIADYGDHHHARWQHQLEERIAPEPIDRGGVDGMIVEMAASPISDALRRTRIPAMTVAHVPDPEGCPAVIVDNVAVGRMAAHYLADLGLKHLAFVPTGRAAHSDDRRDGFTRACAARHVSCTIFGDPTPDDENALANWIRELPDPVGILGVTDRVALAISRACRIAGKRIPEQVALLGVDNEAESCRLADPPLSSIDHGTRRVGYEAARLLDQWMTTGLRPPGSVLIQPIGVVSRPSTDLLAIDDPDLVAAIRLIRSHATDPLKVEDVLKHVAVSRRSLEIHFQQAMGRTIHQEITRVRIDHARKLLITSDWSMPVIADACGFGFASQFSHAFKRETGLPPQQFRNQFRYRRQATADLG